MDEPAGQQGPGGQGHEGRAVCGQAMRPVLWGADSPRRGAACLPLMGQAPRIQGRAGRRFLGAKG